MTIPNKKIRSLQSKFAALENGIEYSVYYPEIRTTINFRIVWQDEREAEIFNIEWTVNDNASFIVREFLDNFSIELVYPVVCDFLKQQPQYKKFQKRIDDFCKIYDTLDEATQKLII